jgi:hypothetical protein
MLVLIPCTASIEVHACESFTRETWSQLAQAKSSVIADCLRKADLCKSHTRRHTLLICLVSAWESRGRCRGEPVKVAGFQEKSDSVVVFSMVHPPKDACLHDLPSGSWDSEDGKDASSWKSFKSDGRPSFFPSLPSSSIAFSPRCRRVLHFRVRCGLFFPHATAARAPPSPLLSLPHHSAAVSRIFLVSPIVLARC